MRPVEIESPLTRAVACTLIDFVKDEKTVIPAGVVQKSLMILKELKQDIAPGEIEHTKYGGMVGWLNSIPSKYYEVKTVKSGSVDRHGFSPRIDTIKADLKRKLFLESGIPRFTRHLAQYYKAKGGSDNLTFITIFFTGDGGFYEIGNGLYRAIGKMRDLVFTHGNKNILCQDIEEYLNGVGHKIGLLEKATTFFNTLRTASGGDGDAELILSLIKFIPPEDDELDILLNIARRIRDEVKCLYKLAKDIRARGVIDQHNLFRNTEEDKDIHETVNDIAVRMNSLARGLLFPHMISEKKFDYACNRCQSWAFALASGALTKETFYAEKHWHEHDNRNCEGDKLINWSDFIGSHKLEEFLSQKHPEEKEELECLCPRRRQAIIKNWGIVFDALVPSDETTIDGDQIVTIYDSFLQALLGSSFALFFTKQLNKIIEEDGLKLGFKLLITQSYVTRGRTLDTNAQGNIKVLKPSECELLEYTAQERPREGYIIIDKKTHEANIHLLGEFTDLLKEAKLTNKKNEQLTDVFTINAREIIKRYIELW